MSKHTEPASIKSGSSPGVFSLLGKLRWQIRRYVLLEGLAWVGGLIGAVFWISLAFDYWFEPTFGSRLAFLFLATTGFLGAIVWILVLRLAKSLRARALALILERRFPQLNDRLITAVEIAEQGKPESGLTGAMLDRAVHEAADLSRQLEIREVFNFRPLARAAGVAVGLLVSIVGFRLAQAETFSTWMHRSLMLSEEFYRRDTDLKILVLAEPGERIVDFHEGVYKHPRGRDLTVLAEVPDERKIPDRVHYRFRNVATSGGNADYFTKIGQRQFRMKLAGLHQSIDLTVRGGDFSTRIPLRIEVVEPPQIERLTLRTRYPDYTGLNNSIEPDERNPVAVLGSQVSLPAGSDLRLVAQCNKNLRSVRIQTERFEIVLDRLRPTGVLITVPEVGIPAKEYTFYPEQAPFAEEGNLFRLPIVLATKAPAPTIGEKGVSVPIPFDPESVLKISLHDEDDVISAEPIRLAINSIGDEPPKIETRLRGIGTSITRQATIPVVGDARDPQDQSKMYGVTDDYGVVEVHFEYRIESSKGEDGAAPFIKSTFANPAEGNREYPLDEKFKVLPLDLSVGQRLTLKVVASDGDNLTGPHVAAGTPYHFQIVSDDELLALIAVKELNIRRRFEQIIEEVRTARKDLLLARTRTAEARSESASADPEAVKRVTEATNLATGVVERYVNGIRKNSNETQSIEQEFGDIRDELENNAVPDVKPTLERINGGIISPLHAINLVDYNQIDDSLSLLLRTLEEKQDPLGRFDDSVDQISKTIEHLDAVLAQMLKLETVNEALQMLRDIIKAQEELQEKTRKERTKKLVEGLQ